MKRHTTELGRRPAGETHRRRGVTPRTWTPRVGVVVAAGIAGTLLAASAQRGPDGPPPVPFGLPPIAWPADNPYSVEKAALGRLIYFDKRLSSDSTVACASCHSPQFGFTDGQPVATGVRGQKGGRSAPTVINSAYNAVQFWDGRAPTLEEQAKGPIANPIEMANSHEEVVRRLAAIPGYRDRFQAAFGTPEISIEQVARVIATFERTVLSGNSPYDRFQAGDANALTPSAQRGLQLFFGKAGCNGCHAPPTFGGTGFANTGTGMQKPQPDWGRFAVTGRDEDRGAFKVPTLREVAATAPYMHDGSLNTLEQVVEQYDRGGTRTLADGSPNHWLDQRIRPLNLTAQEKRDLVEFLHSLSGEGWQHAREPDQFP